MKLRILFVILGLLGLCVSHYGGSLPKMRKTSPTGNAYRAVDYALNAATPEEKQRLSEEELKKLELAYAEDLRAEHRACFILTLSSYTLSIVVIVGALAIQKK